MGSQAAARSGPANARRYRILEPRAKWGGSKELDPPNPTGFPKATIYQGFIGPGPEAGRPISGSPKKKAPHSGGPLAEGRADEPSTNSRVMGISSPGNRRGSDFSGFEIPKLRPQNLQRLRPRDLVAPPPPSPSASHLEPGLVAKNFVPAIEVVARIDRGLHELGLELPASGQLN